MGREQGFTFLELVMAMLISVIVVGVVFAAYSHQQRSFINMRQVAEVQQNLRASMYLLEMGIRSARYDPTEAGFARILKAGAGEFQYEADVNGNANDFKDVADDASDPAEPNERVRFSLGSDCDADKNGIPDDGTPCELVRTTWAGAELPVADNIEALNFVYLNDTGGVIGAPVTGAALNDIRTVEVTIVARSARDDSSKSANPRGYINLQDEQIFEAPEDKYYRRALSRAIDCSNMMPRP